MDDSNSIYEDAKSKNDFENISNNNDIYFKSNPAESQEKLNEQTDEFDNPSKTRSGKPTEFEREQTKAPCCSNPNVCNIY
jgi:hypothetical protein